MIKVLDYNWAFSLRPWFLPLKVARQSVFGYSVLLTMGTLKEEEKYLK